MFHLFKEDYNRNLSEGTPLTREQIGFFLFTKENLLEKKYKLKILNFIKEIEKLIYPEKFDLIRYGWNKNYFVNLTEKNNQKFIKDYLDFKYIDDDDIRKCKLSYEIDLKKNGGKNTSIGDIRLYIHIDGSIHYSRWPHQLGVQCHEIALFLPLDLIKNKEVINLIKLKFLEFNCVYGYINPVISCNIAPTFVVDVLREYTKKRDGIFDIPENHGNDYYNSKVKGAQWGNFLTKEHIKSLGGVEKIKSNLKDFVIEAISKDALYIQMPVSLSFNKKELIPYHKELAKFFRPIYLPKWFGYWSFSGVDKNFLRRFLG